MLLKRLNADWRLSSSLSVVRFRSFDSQSVSVLNKSFLPVCTPFSIGLDTLFRMTTATKEISAAAANAGELDEAKPRWMPLEGNPEVISSLQSKISVYPRHRL